MASNLDDSDILFIEEIKPSTPPNKKWRQRTVNHTRPSTDTKPEFADDSKKVYPLFLKNFGVDIQDFDLKDLTLLSPRAAAKNSSKFETKKNYDSSADSNDGIIELDSDTDRESVKSDSIKFEMVKYEAAAYALKTELDIKNHEQDRKLRDLVSSIRPSAKYADHVRNTRLNSGTRAPEIVQHDPNQMQTEFNEDAETAVPTETYTTYEPKKRKLFYFKV